MYSERMSRLPGAVVWHNRVAVGPKRADEALAAAGSLVLPDGCSDLMFDGATLFVAGPDTRAYDGGLACYVGVRVPSGAGPPLWGVPGSEIVNQRVALADLWPPEDVRRLTERMACATDSGAELERIVAERWRATPPDAAMLSMAASLRAGDSVASVADRHGYSERQLHRRSLAAYGYGAKTLGRILRLNFALDQARRGVRFAVVAHTCGYADQAHLSREARVFTGRTLTQLIDPA